MTDSTASTPTDVADDGTADRGDDGTAVVSGLRSTVLAVVRVFGDAIALGLWTVLLALLFLSTGWPRWAFYALLVLGAVLYVVVTPPWIGKS